MNDDRIIDVETMTKWRDGYKVEGWTTRTGVLFVFDSHEALRARLADTEAERDQRDAMQGPEFRHYLAMKDELMAAEARAERAEAALREAEDFRAEIVVDAFTAPDADWETILDSLRARIRDLSGGIPEDGCYYDPVGGNDE